MFATLKPANMGKNGDNLEPDKDFDLEVGLRIREIREAFQLTRAEFSEQCDLSESFLAAVESGRKGITSKTLFKICTAMNVSADYLIRGKGHGFETDMLVEILNSMEKPARESAIRILREYVYIINYLSRKSLQIEGGEKGDKRND